MLHPDDRPARLADPAFDETSCRHARAVAGFAVTRSQIEALERGGTSDHPGLPPLREKLNRHLLDAIAAHARFLSLAE